MYIVLRVLIQVWFLEKPWKVFLICSKFRSEFSKSSVSISNFIHYGAFQSLPVGVIEKSRINPLPHIPEGSLGVEDPPEKKKVFFYFYNGLSIVLVRQLSLMSRLILFLFLTRRCTAGWASPSWGLPSSLLWKTQLSSFLESFVSKKSNGFRCMMNIVQSYIYASNCNMDVKLTTKHLILGIGLFNCSQS